MRGVFDEQEVDRPRSTRDTELTLGAGTLLAIFVGLVLLCGLCFGVGYSMGHHGAAPTAAASSQAATDQEPLQPSGAVPKPSAVAQTPVAAPADATATDSSAPANGTAPAATTAPAAGATPASADQGQPQVHPALGQGSAPDSPATSTASTIHPALSPSQPAPAQSLMVQVAAVSNQQDADVLVDALRKRDYPVVAHRDPADNYIHIRIGPFATRAIADQWRLKLLNDGYNAVIQP
jgi:DedD protein